MKIKTIALALVTLAASSNISFAAQSGDALHESKCLTCHTSSVYTRSDRKVKSLSQLSRRVEICAKNAASANWDKMQIENVTQYLDTRFYKF